MRTIAPGRIEDRTRPETGQPEQRAAGSLSHDGRRIHGVIPFGVMSIDMGGWTETIEPSAFRGTRFDELRATIDHAGVPLGRYPSTLELEERADGLHWTLDPPQARSDVLEAVRRGDMRSGSWRMIVAPDGERWEGNVRHVTRIAELRDVCIAGSHDPAYPQAAIELRTRELETQTAVAPPHPPPAAVAPLASAQPPAGGLEFRTFGAAPPRAPRTALEEFRAAGWQGRRMAHGDSVAIDFDTFQRSEPRALVTAGIALDELNPVRRFVPPLGFDQRYAWTLFPRTPVASDVTAVDTIQQSARSLATAANVLRTLDAVTAKPETGSTIILTSTQLKQVATICTAIPNIYLEQAGFNSIIENDLRLAIYEGLDKLMLDLVATAGFQAPGGDLLIVSVRKAITTLLAAGWNPDAIVLTPAAAEGLDTLVSGIAGATADWAGLPGWFQSMRRVISKTVPAPVVLDSQAFGRIYTSPVSLARFEADSGTTNSSNIRMELNALGVAERTTAAVRIAAA